MFISTFWLDLLNSSLITLRSSFSRAAALAAEVSPAEFGRSLRVVLRGVRRWCAAGRLIDVTVSRTHDRVGALDSNLYLALFLRLRLSGGGVAELGLLA